MDLTLRSSTSVPNVPNEAAVWAASFQKAVSGIAASEPTVDTLVKLDEHTRPDFERLATITDPAVRESALFCGLMAAMPHQTAIAFIAFKLCEFPAAVGRFPLESVAKLAANPRTGVVEQGFKAGSISLANEAIEALAGVDVAHRLRVLTRVTQVVGEVATAALRNGRPDLALEVTGFKDPNEGSPEVAAASRDEYVTRLRNIIAQL